MSHLDQRLAAFIEYVGRPLVEDCRKILEELSTLNIGLTRDMVREMCFALACWHIIGELIRACTYIGVAYLICRTVIVLR